MVFEGFIGELRGEKKEGLLEGVKNVEQKIRPCGADFGWEDFGQDSVMG